MERKIPTTFIGEMISGLNQVTPEISKGRLRIFYKGLNRNLTYITDEFANKLIQSLPYAPVVGIYNESAQDFGGHDSNRNTAQMYGVVPHDPNFAWEDHLDKDGILRTYACCDVYLYTGRYDAAKQIVGKQQSMELDEKTIAGNWQFVGDFPEEVFVFTDAHFIGLSVLGDDKEPCFEGAAFYELVNKFNNFMLSNTSTGGKDMAVEITKPISTDVQVENEVDETTSISSTETTALEETSDSTETTSIDSEESNDSPDSDSSLSEEEEEKEEAENEVSSDSTTQEKEEEEQPEEKDDDVSTDSEAKEEETNKNEEQPFAECKKKNADCELTAEKFEKLNAEIFELSQKVTTYETEANKYKDLYTALKADYDVLVAEKNKELAVQKRAKLQEYSAYFAGSVKQDFESRLESYSSVEDLEKDLLFAAKPSLFAKREDFAPTSVEEEEEDGLSALIKKSMKH